MCLSLRFAAVFGVCHNLRAREFITGLSRKATCSELNFFVWNNVHLKPGGQNCFHSQAICPVPGSGTSTQSCSFLVLQYFLLSLFIPLYIWKCFAQVLCIWPNSQTSSCFTLSVSEFLFYFPLFNLTATRLQHWMLYSYNNSSSCWSSSYWFCPTRHLVTRHSFAIH